MELCYLSFYLFLHLLDIKLSLSGIEHISTGRSWHFINPFFLFLWKNIPYADIAVSDNLPVIPGPLSLLFSLPQPSPSRLSSNHQKTDI